jgi:Ca2+-binding RTX toxin-like protein
VNTGTIASPDFSNLGAGNDLYDGRLGELHGDSANLGRLNGGLGNDRLYGGVTGEEFAGNDGIDDLRGFGGDDRLFGGSAADAVSGGDGDDLVSGGSGRDFCPAEPARISFVSTRALSASSNVDAITDFSHLADAFQLRQGIFAGLGSAVTAGEFRAGTTVGNSVAADNSDRLIYNKTTGELFYDSDGAGGASKIKFAVLSGSPDSLAFNDFVVI